MRLYIVRHGETEWNVTKRLQGRTDIPLNENGREAARKTAEGIKDLHIDMVISSPLVRAKETAELMMEGRDVPMYVDERLQEISFGIKEGEKNWKETEIFFHSPDTYQPPEGGESLTHLLERTKEFLDDMAGRTERKDKNILVATHGAATRALLANIKHLPLRQFWDGSVPKNCGITLVECGEDRMYRVIWENRVFYEEAEPKR